MTIYINDQEIEYITFPDNTYQVRNIQSNFRHFTNYITWKYTGDLGEYFLLEQTVDILKNTFIHTRICLTLEFLPFARQDQPRGLSNFHGLETMARLINALNVYSIGILTPHSRRALELIDRSHEIVDLKVISQLGSYNTICFPDTSAAKRYKRYITEHQEVIICKKERDKEGNITLGLLEQPKNEFDSILMVDDICDGGATFKAAIKAIHNSNSNEVDLAVTYLISEKALKGLYKAGFRNIHYTQCVIGVNDE